jgi:hypothetical protein
MAYTPLDPDKELADEAYSKGFDAGAEYAEGDLEKQVGLSRAIANLCGSHRMLARSLERDDTRATLAVVERAIARLARRVGR